MKAFEPFEDQPRIAVAVSGGSDSLALALLLKDWVKGRQGVLTALTVDHGLRPESAKEAQQVSAWMAQHHIPHVILPWQEQKPIASLQESARHARYHLLEEWCRQEGYLHLCLAHHQEDQLETVIMRTRSQSGPFGIAGMSAILEKPHIRILRPLLSLSKRRLQQTLITQGQSWLEDPSNRNMRFQRSQLRALTSQFEQSLVVQNHAQFQRYRQSFEGWMNDFLAKEADVSPLGYASLKRDVFITLPNEFQLPVLLHILKTIGVGPYPPRTSSLTFLLDKLQDPKFRAATCHGVRISRHQEKFLFIREAKRVQDHYDLTAPCRHEAVLFDQRIEVKLPALLDLNLSELSLKKIGEEGWSQLICHHPEIKNLPIPKIALWSLPAAWRSSQILVKYNMIYEWLLAPRTKKKEHNFIFKPRYPFSCFIFSASS